MSAEDHRLGVVPARYSGYQVARPRRGQNVSVHHHRRLLDLFQVGEVPYACMGHVLQSGDHNGGVVVVDFCERTALVGEGAMALSLPG